MKIIWIDQTGTSHEIEFDASVSEKHDASAEATKHPVEKGASITDHVIPGPETLDVEVHVSNTPVRPPTTQTRGVQGDRRTLDLGAYVERLLRAGATGSASARAASWDEVAKNGTAEVLQFDGPLYRVEDVHNALLELRRTGQVVTAITSLREYTNMIVRQVSVPRDVENGNAATFTVAFEQVFFADSQEVAAPEPSQERGRNGRNRGNQNGGSPTDGQSESVARRTVGAISRRVRRFVGL